MQQDNSNLTNDSINDELREMITEIDQVARSVEDTAKDSAEIVTKVKAELKTLDSESKEIFAAIEATEASVENEIDALHIEHAKQIHESKQTALETK